MGLEGLFSEEEGTVTAASAHRSGIRFGTSGWRALFAEDFTYANVRKLTHAICGHIKEHPEFGCRSPEYLKALAATPPGQPPLVVIGYDTRFCSEDFAKEAVEVFAQNGIRVLLSDGDAPTPAVAWAVLQHKAVGGVVITASHNPAPYNGYKWTPFWGGPAIPAVTDDIERRAALPAGTSVSAMAFERALRDGWVKLADFRGPYFKQLASLLDIKRIKACRCKIGADALNGTARSYLRPFLEDLGVEVQALREGRDVLFGGRSTEPAPETLAELACLMRKKSLALGLACDGDADRFGILDAGGVWIPPNDVIALALHHLVRNRGLQGKVARSLMTSHFVDAVAKSYGLETRETPVGFKYIGDLLRGGQFLLGGEESGGLSVRGHVPEKDGLLACLLMVELVAYERKPLAKIRAELHKKVGTFFNQRHDLRFDRAHHVALVMERLRVKPPLTLAGSSVWRIDQTDGFKFILKDGSWLGMRPSGTEPVVRLYAEASAAQRLEALLRAGRDILDHKPTSKRARAAPFH